MKIHRDIDQNSLDWLVLRSGKITASEADNIISPTFKRRTGEMVESYLAAKAAEIWLGGPLPGFASIDCELGHILENEAIPFLRFERDMPIERVGFIEGNYPSIGCSPDGVVFKAAEMIDYGVEIKCPGAKNHVRYLLGKEVPADYRVQVAFSMYVTGADRWFFVSYHRHFPALVIEVQRDAAQITEIYFALEAFLPRLEEAVKRIEELNGGPRAKSMATPLKTEDAEFEDITP
jgi:hypothetical protein